MAAVLLGHGACPLCGGRSRVTLSKNQYAVLTCAHCGIQLFTRSAKSDELVRDRITPDPEPAAEPVRTEAPAPDPVRTDPAPVEEEVMPAPPPVRTGQGVGLLKWF